MDNVETINSMIDRIISSNNTEAQQDFQTLIAQKMTQALDAKKQEIASSLYATPQDDNGTEEESEEEPADDASV